MSTPFQLAVIDTIPGGQLVLGDGLEGPLQLIVSESRYATSSESMRTALKTLAGAAKKLEADRVETLAPYRKASETIQAAYKRLAEWLAGATWDLKGRMEALVREAARIAAARAEAEAAAATSNRPTAPLLPRTVEEVKPAFSTYTVTHLEITAPGSIPREFMVPDTAKIRAYLDAGNTVPWARLVTETKVAAR